MGKELLEYFYHIYFLKKIIRNQWLKCSELERLQNRKLIKLINHAYNNIKYYRELFRSRGISPSDIKSVNDLHKVPVTRREDIKSLSVTDIIWRHKYLKGYFKYTTSGTTANPLNIYVDKKENTLQSVLYLRMLFANGYKITDRLLSITHPQFIKKDKKNFFQYLRLFNTKYISIFNHPEENLNFILNFQPNIIRSYIHSIKEIAEEIMKKDIKICNISLVFTTGDFLSKEDREFIANIIKADIIDYYSSTECGLIAWECKKHMGYHINSDTIILELVNHKGERVLPEEIGEVLITNLDQYTMPLIRYAIGDYAILSNTPCSCGRTLPLLKAIIGRNTGLL